MKKILPLLSLAVAASLLLGACGANNEAIIATSVAATVQAQNASASPTDAQSATATSPAASTVIPTLTNIVTPPSPTAAAGSSSYLDCAKASYVSQDPPDATIYAPGFSFFETWKIKNESNCWWNTNYKIIFWDGDLMGSAYVYNLPQEVGPGQTIDIPLQLTTPQDDGTYEGKWKLQTPDGINFGVGQYNQPFTLQVVVNSATQIEYGVASVTFRYERQPESGCAGVNVWYTIYATITTNGPIDVNFKWVHSDGSASSKIKLSFTEAGTQEIKDVWSIHLGSSTGDRTDKLWQVDPTFKDWGGVTFSYLCGG